MRGSAGLRPVALILLAVAAAHGVLLLNDVRLQDDWAYSVWISTGQWDVLSAVQLYANTPLMTYYFWFFSIFADPLPAFRIAELCYIGGAALLVYAIAGQAGLSRTSDRVLIAALSAVYPAYMIHFSLTLSIFSFCYLVFLAAAWLALASEGHAGLRHWAPRTAALLLFFASFAMNSLLVYYAAFALLHWRLIAKQRRLDPRTATGFYLLRRADYLLVPVAFWAGKILVARMFEVDRVYNAIGFDLSALAAGYASYGLSVLLQLKMIFASLFFLAVLVAACLWLRLRRTAPAQPIEPEVDYPRLLLFGLLLALCGTLPYVLVGKPPNGDVEQWGTRVCILLALPMAIIIVAATRLVAQRLRVANSCQVAFLAAAIASSCLVHLRQNVKYEAYSIETRSMMANIARDAQARDIAVFGVMTQLPSIHVLHTMHGWPYVLRIALGGQSLARTAIMEHDPNPETSRNRIYSAAELQALTSDWWSRLYGIRIPENGQQATLAIEPGDLHLKYGRDWRLVRRYLYLKWFKPERLDDFLQGVTRVRVIPKLASRAA